MREVVACARRFASKPTRTQASARAAQDKASVKAVKKGGTLSTLQRRPFALETESDRRRGLARVQLPAEAACPSWRTRWV